MRSGALARGPAHLVGERAAAAAAAAAAAPGGGAGGPGSLGAGCVTAHSRPASSSPGMGLELPFCGRWVYGAAKRSLPDSRRDSNVSRQLPSATYILSPLLNKGNSSGVCPYKGSGNSSQGGRGQARQKHSHPGIP